MKFVEENILGTRVAVTFGDNLEGASVKADALFAELKRIEVKYSRFREDSYLAELNRKRGEWIEVDDETWGLLVFGKELEVKSGGFFNLGIEEVLVKWGYDLQYSLDGGNGQVVHIVGPELDYDKKMVKVNSKLDFGGIGKGYALDRGVEVLEDCGDFLLDFGGDLYGRGEGWKVAFENPLIMEEAIGWAMVDGFFLASSNGVKRSWGNKHHLVNVMGLSPANEMLAVYVQAGRGIEADGLATTLYCMGYELAKKLIVEDGLAAMVIGKDGKIFRSERFVGELFLKN